MFDKEHGIAALLPFLRRFFPDARVVPVAISYNATREECDRALELLHELIGQRTLVVQSTDYSHYLPAGVARQRDQETLNIIAANDVGAVMRLVQPAHLDFKAAQYIQMRLQTEILQKPGQRYRQPELGALRERGQPHDQLHRDGLYRAPARGLHPSSPIAIRR